MIISGPVTVDLIRSYASETDRRRQQLRRKTPTAISDPDVIRIARRHLRVASSDDDDRRKRKSSGGVENGERFGRLFATPIKVSVSTGGQIN
jgi:hypothetical protein